MVVLGNNFTLVAINPKSMNKTFLFALLLPFSVYAQKQVEIKIKGTDASYAGKSFTIQGPNHLKKEVNVDAYGGFKFTLKSDSGFYSIGQNVLFLGPGMNLSIETLDKEITANGNGSAETNALSQFSKLVSHYFPTQDKNLVSSFSSMEPEDFLKQVADFKAEALQALGSKTLNNVFTKVQKDNVEYTSRYFIQNYITRYGIDPEKEKVYHNALKRVKPGNMNAQQTAQTYQEMFTKRLNIENRTKLNALVWENFDINNGALYTFSPFYKELVDKRMVNLHRAELAKSPQISPLNIAEPKRYITDREITDPIIREHLLYQYTLAMIRGKNTDEKAYNDYIALAKDPYYLPEIKTKYDKFQIMGEGKPAPEFEYKNTDNKKVSLSSLEGSYVYIDVWATWCGPCKKEIPHLMKIEEKYAEQNIKFVSISIDKLENKNIWKEFIEINHLPGIQLIADKDWKSDFVKALNINSIPRFILIGPDGKIISANATRPSNPKLQEELDKLLTKI